MLTMEGLLALTTIVPCARCGHDHAPIRDCGSGDLKVAVSR